MARTLEYIGELVIESCWCGIRHAVPAELVDQQRRQHRDGKPQTGIYCPLGHTWVFSGKGRAAELEAQLIAREAELVAVRDQLAASEREARRQAKRVKAGTCPCCKRSFVQLQRHMASKHPGYATGEQAG